MNRSLSADLIKALSMFGVVFIHGSGLLGTKSDFQMYVANIFRFCVPCFIIIWAYFFEKSYCKKASNEQIKYIINKFWQLFTVYTSWSLLYFFVLVDWENLTLRDLVTKHFWGYGWSGQYFFIILFQLLLLYPIIRWIYSNKIILHISIIIISILYIIYGYFDYLISGLISKLGDTPFILWMPYVFLGIALTRQKTRRFNILWIFILLLIPLESSYFGFERSAYINPSVLIASIILCLTILPKSIKVNYIFDKIISLIGKNTMIIFVTNPIVILFLNPIIPNDIFSNTIFWKATLPFISTSIIISISLILDWIIEKVKLNGILK